MNAHQVKSHGIDASGQISVGGDFSDGAYTLALGGLPMDIAGLGIKSNLTLRTQGITIASNMYNVERDSTARVIASMT